MEFNWGKKTTTTFNISLISTILSITPVFAFDPGSVLVIDEGAQLDHPLIANHQGLNQAEVSGQNEIDEDENGFRDDLSGWNQVSNDNKYLPPAILQLFQENRDEFAMFFELHSRAEKGDREAKNILRSNPQMKGAIAQLSDWSHGTHVAGIVASQSLPSNKIYSLNVFTGSNIQIQRKSPEPSPSGPRVPMANSEENAPNYQKAFLEPTLEEEKPDLSTSFFDSDEKTQALVDLSKLGLIEKGDIIKHYVRASGVGVANMSLSMSELKLALGLHSSWQQELMMRGMPPTVPRTAEQEIRFKKVVDGIYNANEASFSEIIVQNPQTLFVIAAGNEGTEPVAQAGNNDIYRVTPANLSTTLKNVISVAATNDKGEIASFSNYSPKAVNVGAPGVAIDSAVVGGLHAHFSGTSMASPYVAGLAARLRGINSKLSPSEIRVILESTGRKSKTLAERTSSGSYVDSATAILTTEQSLLPGAPSRTLQMLAELNTKLRDFNEGLDLSFGLNDIFQKVERL